MSLAHLMLNHNLTDQQIVELMEQGAQNFKKLCDTAHAAIIGCRERGDHAGERAVLNAVMNSLSYYLF